VWKRDRDVALHQASPSRGGGDNHNKRVGGGDGEPQVGSLKSRLAPSEDAPGGDGGEEETRKRSFSGLSFLIVSLTGIDE